MIMGKMDTVALSIIVPILNERLQLPDFFEDLRRQQDIVPELVVCDGGSSDGSWEWLQQQQLDWAALKIIQSPAGRARQLNAGAKCATGDWLLFLHVDSRFVDSSALRKGLDYLSRSGSKHVAGHFALKFKRENLLFPKGYYFYEWKARLGRPETIHGDQGVLLQRDLLDRVGQFCEDLPAMEDTDFAERLRLIGQWQLLPAEIVTSARRFETEGLWQRQLLGALLMCFRAIGWQRFFEVAPDIYRQQENSEKLRVHPFFQLIKIQLQQLSFQERWKIWWQGGGYIQQHAWQLFFAVDAQRAFRNGVLVGTGNCHYLNFFEPIYILLTANLLGRLCATVVLRSWFEVTALWLARKEKQSAG